jgi:hypothetical protein
MAEKPHLKSGQPIRYEGEKRKKEGGRKDKRFGTLSLPPLPDAISFVSFVFFAAQPLSVVLHFIPQNFVIRHLLFVIRPPPPRGPKTPLENHLINH